MTAGERDDRAGDQPGGAGQGAGPGNPTRPAWLTAPVLVVAALSIGAGIAQYAVTTVIGDVAMTFGTPGGETDEAMAQLGLPATTIGIALAIIRLASLGSLPIAAAADRFGRRSVLLTAAAVGLGLTSLAALAPGFWWYVALVAFARPALSAVNAVAGVVAAEEANARDRSASLALIAAAYGLGAGIVAVGRGLLPGDPSFRVVMLFATVALLALPILARRVREPAIAATRVTPTGLPGAIPRRYLGRVALLALLTGSIALATGPGFTYLFVYGEGVLDASPLFLSVLVLAAGPAGLAGILLGRWGADRLGRTPTAGVSMAATGLAVAYAYRGDLTDLAVGYLVGIAASSAFAPPTGALIAELVPTRIRATVAGWETVAGVLGAVIGLTSFGVLADLTGGFAAAARLIGIVVAVVAIGFTWLPETRGQELDQLDADADRPS
ncbi:MAG: MFS transporter [Nitriliruptoraceae bacterium]|nr:MFS transporter [Nitriliruptoraceae bacterium]